MLYVCVRGREMLCVVIRMFYVFIYSGSYEGRRGKRMWYELIQLHVLTYLTF